MNSGLSHFTWIQAITYGAGMQGACTQENADKTIQQALRIARNTGNSIEWCLSMSMHVSNKLKRSNFSESLLTWLLS